MGPSESGSRDWPGPQWGRVCGPPSAPLASRCPCAYPADRLAVCAAGQECLTRRGAAGLWWTAPLGRVTGGRARARPASFRDLGLSWRACRSRGGDVGRRLSAGCPGRYPSHPARGPAFRSARAEGGVGRSLVEGGDPSGGGEVRQSCSAPRRTRVAGRRAATGRAVAAWAVARATSIRVTVSPLLSRREFQGHPTVPPGRPIELAPLLQSPESCR